MGKALNLATGGARWWKAAALAAGAVLVGTLAAAPAAAAPTAQQRASFEPVITAIHESSATNADLWKGVDLRCGGYFLGGGGYVSGPASQPAGLSQLAPGSRGGAVLNDPHAMRVSATAAPQASPADWTLHAYGICAYGLPGVEYQRDYVSATQAGKGPLSAVARCGSGKDLVGMGGRSTGSPRLSLEALPCDNAVTQGANPTTRSGADGHRCDDTGRRDPIRGHAWPSPPPVPEFDRAPACPRRFNP